MARPGLSTHRKFRRLARSLGSPIVARGALELLWDSCYESGDDYVGTAEDIEAAIGWTGEPGELTRAFIEAGVPEGYGFLEPVAAEAQSGPACYRVHDLWHHAPDYVRKRRERELDRLSKVDPSAVRRQTAPGGAGVGEDPNRQDGDGRPPSPTRSPSPSPAPKSGCSAPSPAAEPGGPALLVFPVQGPGGREWVLTEPQAAEWRALFPGHDILADARTALAWVRANPSRKKTARGMPSFLVNWFSRSVNRGGGKGTDRAAAPPRRVTGSTLQQGETDKYAGLTQGLDRHDH